MCYVVARCLRPPPRLWLPLATAAATPACRAHLPNMCLLCLLHLSQRERVTMATVPQLLDLLAAQLGELAPSYQAALPAMRAAFELFDLAVGYRHSGDSSHLER